MTGASAQAAYILDPLPVPAYLWDRRTERFVGWNRAMLDLLGYPADELRSLDWRELLVADEIPVAERAIEYGPEMQHVRWHWKKKNGQVVAVTLVTRATMFVDDDKSVREAYIGLVVGVGTSGARSASEAF